MRIPRQVWFGWLIVAGWMGLIFYASTDRFSSGHTSHFIVPFLTWLFRRRLSEAEAETVHFLVRKCAHLTEYAILAVLTWNALHKTASADPAQVLIGRRTIFGLTLLVSVVYAASDEFHQSFVPSRGASVHDVALDAVGSFLGLVALRGCQRFRRHSVQNPPSPGKS